MSTPAIATVVRHEQTLLTPEGVPVRIELADPGERLLAFLADLAISFTASMCLLILAIVISGGDESHFTLPLTLFATFLVRNAYFLFFELRWGGVTPGKRLLGLRVIDHSGGPLRPQAIVARNLTRQAEFFLPIELLLIAHGWIWSIGDVSPAGLWLLAMGWLMIRKRTRLGDLIAGTTVISIPKRMLLEDLARPRQTFEFTDTQLQVYGILELQVLEDVLRRPPGPDTRRLLSDIRDKIQKRIAWTRPVADHQIDDFLADFYTAQRAFLERRKNFGEERKDKYHGAAAR